MSTMMSINLKMGPGFALPFVVMFRAIYGTHRTFGHWERTIHATVSKNTEEPEHLKNAPSSLFSKCKKRQKRDGYKRNVCRATEVRPGTELS